MNNTLPKPEKEFKSGDIKEYKVGVLIHSVVYGKKANDQITSLYYLIL